MLVPKPSDYILKPGIQDFIIAHENDDVGELLLKQKMVLGVPAGWIAQQISARSRAKSKLPSWYRVPGIVFPPSLGMEQSSSEVTAKFKSNLIQSSSRGADLTGGLGVDAFFLSLKTAHLDYIEPNPEILEVARHNHKMLRANNITHHLTTAEEYVSGNGKLDFIYLDPSRRNKSQKVFRFGECEPNVVKLLRRLFQVAPTIMIKASPLLDLQRGALELNHVKEIVVLAVDNECKELLFILQEKSPGEPLIRAINLDRGGAVKDSTSFTWNDERLTTALFSEPLQFLYEPHAAILKAGAFKWIAQRYHVRKLAANSHLYTSGLRLDFPGRTFAITDHVKLDKKLRERFAKGFVNIITRNYPLTVEEIKKRTGLREGGDLYLIATQSENKKHVMVAERIE